MGIGKSSISGDGLRAPGARMSSPLLGLALLSAGVVLFLLFGASGAAAAGPICPNESLREASGSGDLALPDCRAYEQVSPVEKNSNDAVGAPGLVQSSPSGAAVSYFSLASFPDQQSATRTPEYLSTRDSENWSTEGLLPPLSIPVSAPYRGSAGLEDSTEDLLFSIIRGRFQAPSGSTEVAPFENFLRDNATGSMQPLSVGGSLHLDDASADDSRLLFESTDQLADGGTPGVTNLYEWVDGSFTLVGVLPDGEAPSGGAVAGPGGPAAGEVDPGSSLTQDTISADGSRVFFTAGDSGTIYVRENATRPEDCAIPTDACTVQVSGGTEPALWQGATTDGRVVFYIEGKELYRFDVTTETRERLTSDAAGVLETLGTATTDGSTVYFIATSVLAANTNSSGSSATPGHQNLYEWTQGQTIFVAAGPIGTESQIPFGVRRPFRLTPDGSVLVFESTRQLTAYDNREATEFYRYSSADATLSCLSCNPLAAPVPSGETNLGRDPQSLENIPAGRPVISRNLSVDGERFFFQTEEGLIPEDTNGRIDVYEWEAAGHGTCREGLPTFQPASDGCLFLISTGQSEEDSYLGDAGADGDDVFFFTRQSLVGQDTDANVDVYDARVDGGIAGQNPPPVAPACLDEEACRGTAQAPPQARSVASSGFYGPSDPRPRNRKPIHHKRHHKRHHKKRRHRHGRSHRPGSAR